MKARVYIDGFNFYYGVVHRTKYRWLNLRQLVHQMFPNDDIEHILYATAKVRPAPRDPGVADRQRQYFRALKSLPDDFEITEGYFSQNVVRLPFPNPQALSFGDSRGLIRLKARTADDALYDADVINPKVIAGLSAGDFPLVHVVRNEEKGSDVTLGARMVFDACRMDHDFAVLFSNDSDLRTPVTILRNELGLKVVQVVPTRKVGGKHSGRKSVFRGQVDEVRHEINDSLLAACQFPDPLIDNKGATIQKPSGW